MKWRHSLSGARRGHAPPCIVPVVAVMMLCLTVAPLLADEGLSVLVSPNRAHTVLDGSVRFTATALDGYGGEIAAELAWSVIPPRLGRITPDGLFTSAGIAGRGVVRVVATRGREMGAGHAVVEVGGEPSLRLSVVVRPPAAAFAQGETGEFDAIVTDPSTGAVLPADLTWMVVPDHLGSLDATGLFTASGEAGAGRIVVRALHEDREGLGDAGVVIGDASGPDIKVRVIPRHALLRPGEESRFGVRVTDSSGDPLDVEVDWSIIPARLGVIDYDGLFTAGREDGVGRVIATVVTEAGPVRDMALVEVKRPGPGGVRIALAPGQVALAPEGDVQFEATVIGPEGDELEIPVDWRVRPDWLGSITADGFFTASAEYPEPSANGGWMGGVVASIETGDGAVAEVARVFIRESGPPLRLDIRPQQPRIAPGDDVQFETEVVGADDSIDWTNEWAVFPENLGAITPEGLFIANPAFGDPNSGEFGSHEGVVAARATLSDGSILTDLAHVRVRLPGQPVRIRVTPVYSVVPVGESREFVATVIGTGGDVLEAPVTWRVVPERLGIISPDGIFTAADLPIDPGEWQRPHGSIIAEVRAPGGQVFRGIAIIVLDLPDPEIRIHVTPRSATVEPAESVGFSAEVSDIEGNPVELPVVWHVVDEVVGTIGPDGVFTASGSVPGGGTHSTRIAAGVVFAGRTYWDFAKVRVSAHP